MFAKNLTGCFSHCCVKGVDHWIHVCISPIIAWKVSNTLGSFSFSRSNLSLVCFGLLIFCSGEGGRSSSASHDHFQCLFLENVVFWHCSLLIGSASSLECNQSGCGVVHLGYAMSTFRMPCNDQMCSQTQDRWRWRTPGLSIPWYCLPTSSFVWLVFFPLSLCLARWFWPDLMNGTHDYTAACCVSLRLSGGLRVVQFPAGSWHELPCW